MQGHRGFVIVDRNGKPLADLGGKIIVLASRTEAQAWLQPGEWVVEQLGSDDPPDRRRYHSAPDR